ncbi:MAG: hypothetical protein P4L58_03465, partial [Candidatus Pacebacteria bacterium]|nr:hypothetical protein [Candidatus Paceibacterota bacterium]
MDLATFLRLAKIDKTGNPEEVEAVSRLYENQKPPHFQGWFFIKKINYFTFSMNLAKTCGFS